MLIEGGGDQDTFSGTGIDLISATASTFALIAFICLLVELFVAPPLLLGYRSFRWRYLTRWTAALIGLGIGVAPALLLLSQPLGDGTSVMLGYFYDGRLTASGWWRLLRGTALSGAVGFASAAAFAFVAVRKAETGPRGEAARARRMSAKGRKRSYPQG